MDFIEYEGYEESEVIEQLEDGVYLEHFTAGLEAGEISEPAELYGDPEHSAEFWTKADSDISDGLMCERYIAEELTGGAESERELLHSAAVEGRCSPEYGSPLSEVGSHLEKLGLEVSRESGCTIDEIREALDNNEKIICAVSSVSIRFPEIGDMTGLRADSLVEVIGVDDRAQDSKHILLNDPAASTGGTVVDTAAFVSAWEKGGCYAVFVRNS